MKISAVIPTRNRPANLKVALRSLADQTRRPDEILVVDSSDDKQSILKLKEEFADAPVLWMDSKASVCLQRNAGIRSASGDWIFLCDDDIQLPPDYLEKLENCARSKPEYGVLCGRLLELEEEVWKDQYPVTELKELLFRFIFQLPVWGKVDEVRTAWILRPFYAMLKWFYRMRGNGFTIAGWPLITDWNGEVVHTSIYSLGANLIRKEWLLNSPYDEVLDSSGIGDNYGVALNFPGEKQIHVVTSTEAYHHKAMRNRVENSLAYFRRILALHYFMLRKNRITFFKTAVFVWSLCGNVLLFVVKGNRPLLKATWKAIRLIICGRNPYWVGFSKNEKVVEVHY